MPADNEHEKLPMVNVWLGFEPDKKIYDVEHDVTLDDLVASLVSHKGDRKRRRTVQLRATWGFSEVTLDILVRSLTQMYTPTEAFEDSLKIEGYYEDPEWAIEGWIATEKFDPSPKAPAIRCFFHTDNCRLLERELQFINPPIS